MNNMTLAQKNRSISHFILQAEDGIRDGHVTGVQTCALPIFEPAEGLPDMVYSANGALLSDGIVYTAKFTYPERAPEAPLYGQWFADRGFRVHEAQEINEGEGDILTVAIGRASWRDRATSTGGTGAGRE